MVKFTLKGISNLTESPAYFQQVNGIYRKDGALAYGRYGGVGYYHVSDQYIALFSNFISSSVHESVYLLDGVVENDSEMQIHKVYGDSWAQSEV